MVTIYDIAAATGFSPATVSKAFNAYPGVSKKTQVKIMDTAKAMGYTPNSTARTLSTKKSWLVGMLFSEEIATGIIHPHFSEIVSSAQIELGKAGYDVVFINNFFGGGNVSYIEHCRYRGVDGVIMAASAQFGQMVRCIVESDLKVVSVETTYPGKYSVISDNYGGGMMAMEHLYALGHRQIAHIATPLNSLAGRERYQAYLDFLKEKDISFDPSLVVETAEYSTAAGYDAIKKLAASANGRFTAVFTAWDNLALAVMHGLREIGLRVPEDVSVIGFDDLAHVETTELTTIRQDRAKIGSLAAEILIAQMQDLPIRYTYDTRMPVSLVSRASCMGIL
uniref:Putative transcriptional regulator n=1 Tax=termite gut metagenome TaxID=433724 RepID=S0DG01_9ZZZZ